MHRTYTLTPPQFSSAFGNPQQPIPTADGGYLLIDWFWLQGFEFPGGLYSGYVIKTDSNFVPQWKRQAAGAVALPTGGYILYYHNTIEKVTASGAQVFIKHLTQPIFLNGAVLFGNRVRFAGSIRDYQFPVYLCDAASVLIDTTGNYISHARFQSSLYNGLFRLPVDFSQIKRDSQGNFYVYSNEIQMAAIGSVLAIAKFDSSFTFLWAKVCTGSFDPIYIKDIDFLPGGRMFVSATTLGNNLSYVGIRTAMLKLDDQGNVLSQYYLDNRFRSTALLKKANGNYVMGAQGSADSLFLFEADTSMNVIWHNVCARGTNIGGSVLRNNLIYTPIQKGHNLVVISNDSIGNSCTSYSVNTARPTRTITLSNFTLTNVPLTLSLANGTVNNQYAQNYTDSCKCGVFIPGLQKNYCVGNTATVNVYGTGNLSWYGSATGTDFIKSGPQYTYSSTSPTVLNIYVQDSACVLAPVRTLVSLTVHPVPFISFYPPNPLVCPGQQVVVTVNGAVNYTWSHNLPPVNYQYLNSPVNTVYTVTGSNAPNCNHTSTVALTIVPVPTVTAISSGPVCLGQSATFTANGAINYTWTGGTTGPTHTATPVSSGAQTFVVTGNNNACNAIATVSVLVLPAPSLTVFSTPPVLCAGIAATVSALGATSYSWSTGSTSQAIVHVPLTNTVFMVTGFLGQCSSTAAVPFTVNPVPTVIASASQATACAGTQVIVTASGASGYFWVNGPSSATHTPTVAAGMNYFIVSGSNGSCTANASLAIAGIPGPNVNIAVSAPTVCAGDTITVSASGGVSYNWSHGPTANSFTATFPLPGQTVYSVTASNGSCTTQSQVTVAAKPVPTVIISASSTTLCAGSTVTLIATGGTGYNWNHGPVGNNVIVNPATSTVFAVLSGSNGCLATGSVSLMVTQLPVINISSASNTVCIGDQVALTASGAFSYTWDGGQNTAVRSVTAAPTPMNYSVVGLSGQCTGSASAVVLGVSPPAMTVVTQPQLICSGAQVTLSAGGAQTYTWMNGSNGASIKIPATTGAAVTLTGAIGTCTNNITVPWNVLPSPTITVVSSDSVACAGDLIKITASGATSYTWNSGATKASIQAIPITTTVYTVTGAAANGCTLNAIFTQKVDPCTDIADETSETLQVFPNPTSGIISITHLSGYSGIAQLTSIEGKILLEQTFSGKQLQFDIGFLPPGIYVLRLGMLVHPVKIIRQ